VSLSEYNPAIEMQKSGEMVVKEAIAAFVDNL
jgi:hypothetical protein